MVQEAEEQQCDCFWAFTGFLRYEIAVSQQRKIYSEVIHKQRKKMEKLIADLGDRDTCNHFKKLGRVES